ncbi:MAG: ABC transporter permease subunit [Tissierellaceae bacterium]|nr:ABC transporter permease subunit [Tissierellaceae bacterium]
MNIVNFEVKRHFKSSVTWALICSAVIILFMALFPSMENSGIQQLVAEKMGAFPEGFMEAFGLDDMVDFTDIMQYLAYTIQYISMAIAIYGLILGSNSLLSEEAEGTIEFLYAQPVERNKIVGSKILSSALLLFQSIFIIGLFTMVISAIFKPDDYNVFRLFMDIKEVFIGIAFSSYIYFSIGLLLSTILKPSQNTTAVSIGIFFITYVLGVLSRLKDNLEWLKFLSPFDYALPMDIVRYGWENKYIVAGTIIMLFTILFTFIIYNRKDMKI